MNILKLWPVKSLLFCHYTLKLCSQHSWERLYENSKETYFIFGCMKTQKIQSNDNFFNKWSKNISFTDLLHKIGKLVFKHVVSAYNWDVCKTFTARGVGLYQCQNWKSIEDIISIVHQAGTRVCLGIFDRKRREEDIFMCQKNATYARSQNTLHSHWSDMCPVPRSGPVP